ASEGQRVSRSGGANNDERKRSARRGSFGQRDSPYLKGNFTRRHRRCPRSDSSQVEQDKICAYAISNRSMKNPTTFMMMTAFAPMKSSDVSLRLRQAIRIGPRPSTLMR